MSWFEQKIRLTSRCASPRNRIAACCRSHGASNTSAATANERDPRAFLDRYVADTSPTATNGSVTPADDYAVADNVLTFTSAIASPWPENNRVHAQLFPARNKGPAVVVLAQWNARWEEQQNVCRWLNKLGLTAVKMSLPYHDRRSIPGHPRADHLIGPNIGLTMQANRQAVLDVRRTLRWLEQQGYGPLGLLGTSIGSAIGFIAMCHEPMVRRRRVPACLARILAMLSPPALRRKPFGNRSAAAGISLKTSFATSGRRSARSRISRG